MSESYRDAHYVLDNNETNSTSGYVFTFLVMLYLGNHPKQTCIAKSTMEFEFIALELVGHETKWLKGLLVDFPL